MKEALWGLNGIGITNQITPIIRSYWAGAGAGWFSDGTGGNNPKMRYHLFLSNSRAGPSGGGGRKKTFGRGSGWFQRRWIDGNDEGGDGGFGGGGGGGTFRSLKEEYGYWRWWWILWFKFLIQELQLMVGDWGGKITGGGGGSCKL